MDRTFNTITHVCGESSWTVLSITDIDFQALAYNSSRTNTVEPLYRDTPEMRTSPLIRTPCMVPAKFKCIKPLKWDTCKLYWYPSIRCLQVTADIHEQLHWAKGFAGMRRVTEIHSVIDSETSFWTSCLFGQNLARFTTLKCWPWEVIQYGMEDWNRSTKTSWYLYAMWSTECKDW